MIILTGANTETAKDDFGRVYEKFSFKGVINETVRQAEKFGYTPVVYDLGSLGMGELFQVNDEVFAEKGYYAEEPQNGYKSKSLFKPEMVRDCLSRHRDLTVYMDGDATLYDRIDEVAGDDYDVGVTLRKSSEMQGEWYEEHFEIVKYVNAGVIFFNPTEATFGFLDKWEQATIEVGNDQWALNKLTSPEACPEPYSVVVMNGVRIKYFPCEHYNYYYFDEGLVQNIKIMHFKGPVRKYYPFNWKNRLYCLTVIPILNIFRAFVIRMVSKKEA
jgi:hypothetical protein